MRALNRHIERVFNPDHKDHHWGKRKLKRDEIVDALDRMKRRRILRLSIEPILEREKPAGVTGGCPMGADLEPAPRSYRGCLR